MELSEAPNLFQTDYSTSQPASPFLTQARRPPHHKMPIPLTRNEKRPTLNPLKGTLYHPALPKPKPLNKPAPGSNASLGQIVARHLRETMK